MQTMNRNLARTIICGIIVLAIVGMINPFVFVLHPEYIGEAIAVDIMIVSAVIGFITGTVIEAKREI